MKKIIVTREFTFDSAHSLANCKNKCSNLHGHTYRLQVSVNGNINKNGMVMDFSDLKKIVNEGVVSILDHCYLNKLIKQPTAENISIWIWNKLKNKLKLCEIKLWETPSSFVSYRGD